MTSKLNNRIINKQPNRQSKPTKTNIHKNKHKTNNIKQTTRNKQRQNKQTQNKHKTNKYKTNEHTQNKMNKQTNTNLLSKEICGVRIFNFFNKCFKTFNFQFIHQKINILIRKFVLLCLKMSKLMLFQFCFCFTFIYISFLFNCYFIYFILFYLYHCFYFNLLFCFHYFFYFILFFIYFILFYIISFICYFYFYLGKRWSFVFESCFQSFSEYLEDGSLLLNK
jgi:hypothetical protein